MTDVVSTVVRIFVPEEFDCRLQVFIVSLLIHVFIVLAL